MAAVPLSREVAMSVQRALGAGLAATTFAGALVSAPAAAEAAGTTALVLTVKVAGRPTAAATLRCAPPRGSHQQAAAACAAVDAVKGRLDRLKPRDGVMCAMLYQPAIASAAGTWRGHPVRYRKTFSNTCVLTGDTGAVFAF
jgi:hypothetical protein